jgi:hypothetical protein
VEKRKNVDRIIDAFAAISPKYPDYRWYCRREGDAWRTHHSKNASFSCQKTKLFTEVL